MTIPANPQSAFYSDSKEVWGCFLMSEVRMLHFSKDWWKFTQIHQYYGFNYVRQNGETGFHRLILTHTQFNFTFPRKGGNFQNWIMSLLLHGTKAFYFIGVTRKYNILCRKLQIPLYLGMEQPVENHIPATKWQVLTVTGCISLLGISLLWNDTNIL